LLDILINRPIIEDTEILNHFFRIVLVDTFCKNGISDLVDTFEEELFFASTFYRKLQNVFP